MVIESVRKGVGIAHSCGALIAFLFVFQLLVNAAVLTVTGGQPIRPESWDAQKTLWALILGPILFAVGVWVRGGVLASIGAKLKGQPPAGSVLGLGGRFFPRLLVQSILVILVSLGIFLVSAVVIGILGSLLAKAGAVMAALATVLAIIALMAIIVTNIYLIFSGFMIVADDKGAVESLGASARFVGRLETWAFWSADFWRQRYAHMVLILIILTLMGFAAMVVMQLVGGIGVALKMPAALFIVLNAVLGAALNSYVSMISSGTIFAYYLSSAAESMEFETAAGFNPNT